MGVTLHPALFWPAAVGSHARCYICVLITATRADLCKRTAIKLRPASGQAQFGYARIRMRGSHAPRYAGQTGRHTKAGPGRQKGKPDFRSGVPEYDLQRLPDV